MSQKSSVPQAVSFVSQVLKRDTRLVLGDPLPGDNPVLPTPEMLKAKCCTVAPLQQGEEPLPSPSASEEEMSWTV